MSYLIQQLKKYNIKTLGLDILAGLSVAIVVIPQGMAYAVLAGLSPVYGLYAATIPLIIYILFASSPSVQIGPMALMSITVFSGISLLAEPGTDEYLHLVLMTSLLAGVLQVLYGKFKLGVISSYLSKPVLHGFMSAAGVIIIIGQIKALLSLDFERSSSMVYEVANIISNINQTNLYSLLLGFGGIIFINILKRINPFIPGFILAAIIGSALLYYFNLENNGVPITGSIPDGLPTINYSFLTFDNITKSLPTAFVVSLICFIGTFAIGKAYETDQHKIDSDKELVALGLSKIVGSFFLAMPTTGSFSRSAVNNQSGARTGMSIIFTALIVGITLTLLCGLFYYLPKPILGAIVVCSATSLIKWKQLRDLWQIDRKDFLLFIATLLTTIILGVVYGIIVGVLLSLLLVIIRAADLEPFELGKVPKTGEYRSFHKYPNALRAENTLILRYDQDLFFVNAESFYNQVVNRINTNKPKNLILHLGSVLYFDSVGLEEFQKLLDYCNQLELNLKLSGLKAPLRDKLNHVGVFSKIEDICYYSIEEAVKSLDQ